MPLVIVTPPATEPVSVAEAAAQLRIPPEQEAATLAAFIAAAREIVEARTGCALVTRRVRETRDVSDLDRDGAFAAAFAPVRQVMAARWLTKAGASGALVTALSSADPSGRVRTTPPAIADAVEVEMTVGYGAAADAPAALRQAVLEIACALSLGRSDQTRPIVSARCAALLQPYVRRRSP